MMQRELENRLQTTLDSNTWDMLQRIYTYHPAITDVGGKDQFAALVKRRGVHGVASAMLKEANATAARVGAAPIPIELDAWYGTEVFSDDGQLIEVRPKTLQQVYTYLRDGLGDLVDEYFSIAADSENHCADPWPQGYRWIAVFPVTGGSEGHYVHVERIQHDGSRDLVFLAKTFLGMEHAWRIARRLGDLLQI